MPVRVMIQLLNETCLVVGDSVEQKATCLHQLCMPMYAYAADMHILLIVY